MPRAEGAVLTTTREGELIRVRPEPPADLWEQLAELNEQAAILTRPQRPPGSFTTIEYADKFGLSAATALRRIRKMLENGSVQKHGNSAAVFYTVVQK